ncbi:MAG TPA: VWA domain-containing protein [Dehalococcoidia bacterium]
MAIALAPAVVPGAANAQQHQLQITSVVTKDWPSVEVTATIVDPTGQPITGLSAQNFNVKSGESAIPVTGVTTTSDPSVGIAVVLAFDVSGSMAGQPLDEAKSAGKALIDQLGPSDEAAIVAFSDQTAVVQGLTTDKPRLDQAIDGLAVGGNTALYAAVGQSIAVAQQAPLPRRAVVLLTDGVDFGVPTTITRDQTLDLVGGSGTTFVTIGLGSNVDSAYLSDLATKGRGQYSLAPTPADLRAVYQTAAAVLRQQYVLSLNAGGLNPGSGVLPLHVEVTVGNSVLAADATLTVPAGLLPATATAAPQITAAPPPSQSQPSGGSSSSLPVVALAGAAALVLVGASLGLVVLRRRRRRPTIEIESGRFEREPRASSFPEIQRAADEESGAWLELPTGEKYALRQAPVTIGFTPDCVIALPDGFAVRHERARIWRRDGRYMLHNLSRLGSVMVAGKAAVWVILEDGDDIVLGPQKIVFRDPQLDGD